MDIKLDNDYLVSTLSQLVKINSVNPDLSPGAPGEVEIGNFILTQLAHFGFESEVQEIADNRVNVVCLIKGAGSGPSLMLNVHMDTVGVSNMTNPFSGAIKHGKLFGRGSFDTKAGIAAILTMVKGIADHNIRLEGDLLLAFVADEEYGSIGTEHLLATHTTDSAIVLEPTELDICTSHKGYGLFEFTTLGKAAHGGKPLEGIDANRHMGLIMNKLNELAEKLQDFEAHPLLGIPSMHIPTIHGGSEPFTYAATCVLQLERRTLPGETLQNLLAEYQAIIDDISTSEDNFTASIKTLIWRDPYEISKDKELVVQLANAIEAVTHSKPNYIAHSWWEDSGLTGNAGIDTVVLGPKGAGLHTIDEWVDLESVSVLADILLKVSMTYLGNNDVFQ